ncbi:hypothetical protein AEMCBJ_31740 (plasmid) [Cupriavidus necator]
MFSATGKTSKRLGQVYFQMLALQRVALLPNRPPHHRRVISATSSRCLSGTQPLSSIEGALCAQVRANEQAKREEGGLGLLGNDGEAALGGRRSWPARPQRSQQSRRRRSRWLRQKLSTKIARRLLTSRAALRRRRGRLLNWPGKARLTSRDRFTSIGTPSPVPRSARSKGRSAPRLSPRRGMQHLRQSSRCPLSSPSAGACGASLSDRTVC